MGTRLLKLNAKWKGVEHLLATSSIIWLLGIHKHTWRQRQRCRSIFTPFLVVFAFTMEQVAYLITDEGPCLVNLGNSTLRKLFHKDHVEDQSQQADVATHFAKKIP